MKRWKVLSESRIKNQELRIKNLVKILLENRGIKTKKKIDEFLNPRLENVTIKSVDIDGRLLRKAIDRIQTAIKNKEKIVVFGDYDVDGICGTAILWETLHGLGADVMPYIPHRIDEGYGLSVKAIQNSEGRIQNVKLIITVDNGIVANKAVEFANEQGIDVIVTDHHVPSKKLPDAYAIVHTTKLCGAGVEYLLAQELTSVISNEVRDPMNIAKEQGIPRSARNDKLYDDHLALVALATIADLVSLVGANRTLVKFGLEQLNKTKRIGLLELYKEAGLDQSKSGVYEVGHIIAPRLNAMGRLEYAMDSLRLLCTNNRERAKMLAQKLGSTNRERQELTLSTVENAKFKIQNSKLQLKIQNLLFIADSSYQQGVIGLVAGKLVEEFYRPAIVVSVGEKYSKASARSINGFNIIEFIRGASQFLVDAGGHPMAAGFTVETTKLSLLQKALEERARELLSEETLTRTLRIDCELPLNFVSNDLYDAIQNLAPFGMGNPEPVFVSRAVTLEDIKVVGKEGNHLKLFVAQSPSASSRIANRAIFGAIAFGMGERANEFNIGDKVDVVYTIDRDKWNGNERLKLKVKDLRR